MPVASLYKKLSPLVLDKSCAVTSTSPPGSDGYPYSVRSGAFLSNDRLSLNVISVNRDRNDTIWLEVNDGISEYHLDQATLLTATGLASDSFIDSHPIADTPGYRAMMPPLSVLILEYSGKSTGIKTSIPDDHKIRLYPNPACEFVTVEVSSPETEDALPYELRWIDMMGRIDKKTFFLTKRNIVALHLPAGLYFYEVTGAGIVIGHGKLVVLLPE